jgi:hypothetical protein
MLLENTPQKRAEYREELLAILDRADILDAKAMRQITALVREMQHEVNDRLSFELGRLLRGEGGSWGVYWLPRLQAAIADVVREIGQRTAEELSGHLADSYSLGAEIVDTGLSVAKGLQVTSPVITARTLSVIAPFSAKLIVAITDSTRETIDKAIRRTVALGEAPDKLMQKLQGHIGTEGTPFRTVAQRAEVIARTELSRVQGLASEARLRSISQEFPELNVIGGGLKQQFATVQRGPYPCKICRPYHGKIFDMLDAEKPIPPLHPQCRCVLLYHAPGVSTIVEPIVRRQEKASLTTDSRGNPRAPTPRADLKRPRRTTEAHKPGCTCGHH